MEIAGRLMEWYRANGRNLPWRETRDPYFIWISEIILQQTRVAQGLEYYLRFTERFPDVRSLAEAGEDEVMRYWQGLGYYSRARNLHAAAREVMERFGGVFPSRYEDVLSLKGIGGYTAAAVCSFAWQQPYAVLDGNVFRVLSRIFGVDTPVDTPAGRRDFSQLAESQLDRRYPDIYNQAIMDFGALVCTPKQPACLCCPFWGECRAAAEGKTGLLPVKQGKTKIRSRYFNYLDISCGTVHLMRKRKGKDIWRDLYEYPLIETDEEVGTEVLEASEAYVRLMEGVREIRVLDRVEMPVHQLSHRSIHAVFYRIQVDDFAQGMDGFVRVGEMDFDKYAVSRLIGLYREKVLD